MSGFDAWWLPGFVPTEETAWWTHPDCETAVRAPCLTPSDVRRIVARLQANRRAYLCRLTVDEIAHRVGAAVNRWLDPFSPYLHTACGLIPMVTGYDEAAVRKGLAGFLSGFRTENLRRLLRDELGDPELLDGFRPRLAAPGRSRATGPGLVVHSFAGNVPGLPAQSLVAATLVKASSLGKLAADEPIFAPLFLRSLADVDPRLADCLAVTYWPGDDIGRAGTAAAAAFAEADVVVAYGSDEAIEDVRSCIEPHRQRLLAYGHRLSFGVLARERLSVDALNDIAERAAYDVVRFDQQGCLSPHLFYVERGGAFDAAGFAAALATALDRWAGVVPRGRLTSSEQARIAEVRRAHEFRAATGGSAVFGGATDDWCVLLDTDPAFAASCLNRTVWVKPIDDLQELPQLLAPVRGYLQTAGLAASPDRIVELAELLADAGLDRVTPLGQMGDPPLTWHHDGRFNLLDFLRFTDLEPESSAGRWEFTHPDQGLLGRERRPGLPVRLPGGRTRD